MRAKKGISLDFQKIEHEEGLTLLIRNHIEKKRKQKLYDDETKLNQFSATIISVIYLDLRC